MTFRSQDEIDLWQKVVLALLVAPRPVMLDGRDANAEEVADAIVLAYRTRVPQP